MDDLDAFKQAETRGWEIQGTNYHKATSLITPQAIPHLLDLAGVDAGSKVMVLACGPGFGVAEAAERGAEPQGVDVSESMLDSARRLFPNHRFEQGDAEALGYSEETFDAVVCPFGVLHFAYPERAFAEVHRVLKPGGGFAFSVWATPEHNPFFALAFGSIQKHGTLDVDVPQGPDIFAFADHEVARRTLEAAGFTAVEARDIDIACRFDDPEWLVDTIKYSTVRIKMVLDAHTEKARQAIYEELRAQTENLRVSEGGYLLPFSAVCVGARKM